MPTPWIHIFSINSREQSSSLKRDTICEALVSIHKSTWRHYLKDQSEPEHFITTKVEMRFLFRLPQCLPFIRTLYTSTLKTGVVVVRFEVFTAVTMKNGVFWVVRPCGSCTNRFLSPWWRRRQVPPKHRFLQEPHGVTTQKTPFLEW
jgi:hypothetical protein